MFEVIIVLVAMVLVGIISIKVDRKIQQLNDEQAKMDAEIEKNNG